MYTILRKVGKSITITIPAQLLAETKIRPGERVPVGVEQGRLFVGARTAPRYRLSDLMLASDPHRMRSADVQAWTESSPVGRELL